MLVNGDAGSNLPKRLSAGVDQQMGAFVNGDAASNALKRLSAGVDQ